MWWRQLLHRHTPTTHPGRLDPSDTSKTIMSMTTVMMSHRAQNSTHWPQRHISAPTGHLGLNGTSRPQQPSWPRWRISASTIKTTIVMRLSMITVLQCWLHGDCLYISRLDINEVETQQVAVSVQQVFNVKPIFQLVQNFLNQSLDWLINKHNYDTIGEFNVDSKLRKLSIQLYLAHVARKRN